MADRIKLRRGAKSKIDLNVYELGYATDSTEKRLYFNDGSMVPIPNEKDINDIKAELTEATNVSNQNKKDVSELKESVAGIIRTGVAKLVMYSYDVKLSEDTQKVNIPYKRFDSATDTLKVYVNGIAIPNEYYTITNPVENDGIITNGYIVLTESRPVNTIVRFEIWKNVPSGEEGAVSGSVIKEGSLPLNRIQNIPSNYNYLINGNFQINQRGKNEYIDCFKYTVDRWKLYNSNKNGEASGKMIIKNGYITLEGIEDNTKQLYINQIIENCKFQNNKVTFSCDISIDNYISGNVFIQIGKRNGSFSYKLIKPVNNEWHRYSCTFEVPDDGDLFVAIGTYYGEEEDNRDYILLNNESKINIRNCKVEIGDTPTPFIPKSFYEELAICQKYYQILNPFSFIIDGYITNGDTRTSIMFNKMRSNPTASLKLQNETLELCGILGESQITNVNVPINGVMANGESIRFNLDYTKLKDNQTGNWFVGSGISDLTIVLDSEIY